MMDGQQLSSELSTLIAKTVEYKAALKSLKVGQPRIAGALGRRDSHPIVLTVNYNIANSPIVGGDLRDCNITYELENVGAEDDAICAGPQIQEFSDGSDTQEISVEQLAIQDDSEPKGAGQATGRISLKQDPAEGREIDVTKVEELALETGRHVSDTEESVLQDITQPDEHEKGHWSFIGLRVVRGPDWQSGDEDGGCGCVGTVVPVQDAENKNSIWVRWDSGVLAEYRGGKEGGKFDLRIYDNAQRGVKHPGVACDGCSEEGVVGIRWKCLQCDDYDLCHACYNQCTHDLRHQFLRIDEPGVAGVKVPCRLGAKTFIAYGIFTGAKVVRGHDWKWKDQDGQSVGTVTEIEQFGGKSSYRGGVRVTWAVGRNCNYRCGFRGKMDLQYFKKGSNEEFFIEHLPTLDATKCRPWFTIGDKVRLRDIDVDQLKELQQKRCGWIEAMRNFRGKTGKVEMVDSEGDVRVKFGRSNYVYNFRCLERKTIDQQYRGRCLESVNLLIKAAVAGNVVEVKKLIATYPDAAQYPNEQGVTALQVAAHRGHLDVVIVLVEAKAPLELKDGDGDTALAFAVIGNKSDVVQYLLLVGSNPNTSDEHGVTPLHLAVGQDKAVCAQALLGSTGFVKCDVNSQDMDGDTALFIAIGLQSVNDAMIDLLIEHTTEEGLMLTNNKGFNSLHYATLKGNNSSVEKILRRSPSMINIAKSDGFMALHIAAINGYSEIVATLLKQETCDTCARTVKGQTARDLAVEERKQECIDLLDAVARDMPKEDTMA